MPRFAQRWKQGGLPGSQCRRRRDQGDYGLAPFDIRNVVHFSGGYELPFGKGKRYMAAMGA